MALFNDAKDVYEAWKEPDFSFADITAPIAVGTDLLSAALDPVGALIAAPLAELMSFCIQHIPLVAEPLEKLAGSDDAVKAQKDAWDSVGKEFVAAGNAHADAAGDLPSWTGDAADMYKQLAKETNRIFQAVDDGCRNMGLAVEAAGQLVGMLRGFVWDMITELLTTAIEYGLAALAAAIPSLGSSLAAFASWYTAKVGAVALKIYKYISTLLKRAKHATRKFTVISEAIGKARRKLHLIIKQLQAAQRLKGRTPTNLPSLNADQLKGHVPKGVVPGDTTVGYTRGNSSSTKTAAGNGPLEGGNHGPVDLKQDAWDALKGQPKAAAKNEGINAADAALNNTLDEDVRTIE